MIMIKTLLITGFLICLAFQLTAQVVHNVDFETTDAASITGAATWKNSLKYPCAGIDSMQSHSGKYSMCLRADQQQGMCYFVQRVLVSPAGLKRYRLSGWIKTDSIKDGYTGIYYRTTNKDSSIIYYDMRDRNLCRPTDWKHYSFDFYIDELTTRISLGAIAFGKGRAWFDDIKLESVNDTTACSPEARDYITEVFSIIQKNSIRRDSLDLPNMQKNYLSMLNGAKTTADCYPLIQLLLSRLGDHHSFFQTAAENSDYRGNQDLTQSAGRMLKKKIAYIDMPPVVSTDSVALIDFANNLQKLIAALDSLSPAGWIVDLRHNGGGNCWPMLAGIGPLIGEGVCCYFIDADNNKYPLQYKQGSSYLNDTAQTTVSVTPYTVRNTTSIAVLIGPNTASSGEIVAISFIGKPGCRLFGQPSYGASTGNTAFILSDSACIWLTSGIDADRNLKLYGRQIIPDCTISYTDQPSYDEKDPVIQAAIKWLRNKKD